MELSIVLKMISAAIRMGMKIFRGALGISGVETMTLTPSSVP